MPRKPLNSLFRPYSNYNKLKKGKSRATFMSHGLGKSSYITDQSRSQGVFAINKSNANGTESS